MRSLFCRRALPSLLVFSAVMSVGCATTRTKTTVHEPGSEPALNGSSDDPVVELAEFTSEERQRILVVKPWVDAAASERALDPNLINAVIWVESRFQPKAKSPAGARGLMQLMPSTAAALAQKMGRSRAASYDPEFNILAGSLYLRKMLDRYDGDARLALAAYNAGAGNVDKWTRDGGDLPPRSEEYVELVMDAKRRFEGQPLDPVVPSTTLVAAAEPDAAPVQRPIAQMPEPEPEPATDLVPDPPVRYDLDRVEADYEPAVDPEPPLADTPWPPVENKRKAEPAADVEDEAPLPAAGVLPSVLD